MNIESWILFSSIALVATISPGPAVLLVTSHSICFGLNRSIFTILGNISGLFVMSLLSVMGLGAVVLYSSSAFLTIKIIGALYLIYLGIRLWRHGFGVRNNPSTQSPSSQCTNNLKLFSQGLMVALSNPKAIAFTTALFPQFIDHGTPLLMQFVILIITFMSYSFLCLYIYARLAITTRSSIRHSRYERLLSRIFAFLFIGSGIGLGVSS